MWQLSRGEGVTIFRLIGNLSAGSSDIARRPRGGVCIYVHRVCSPTREQRLSIDDGWWFTEYWSCCFTNISLGLLVIGVTLQSFSVVTSHLLEDVPSHREWQCMHDLGAMEMSVLIAYSLTCAATYFLLLRPKTRAWMQCFALHFDCQCVCIWTRDCVVPNDRPLVSLLFVRGTAS